MELNEIKDLMKSFDKSDISVLEIEQDSFRIRVEKNNSAPDIIMQPAATAVQMPSQIQSQAQATSIETKSQENEVQDIEGEIVKAPLVGIFYAAASPEAAPYVQVGSHVNEGDTLCLIEAMKMMSEINAPKSGTIQKIFVKNQDVVGFEDPLFLIGD